MTVGEKGKLTDIELDRRVRERLLGSGTFDAPTIAAYLANLPDLEEHSEAIGIDQPALGASSHGRGDADLDDDGSE